jgi:hypothetical protein
MQKVFYEFKSHAGEMHSIQQYVIMFVSDIRKVGGVKHHNLNLYVNNDNKYFS